MAAIAREPSSGLSSPGPDSDIERAGDGSRPATANGSTPLRFIAPIDGSRKNKESPSPEDDDGQPAKKKRHRRTRADLEADRKAAELYPELYTKGKNPHPYDPRMPRPPLPGEPGYQAGMPAAKVKQMMLDAVAAGIASPAPSHVAAAGPEAASASTAAAAAAAASRSPPIVMSPYAATLAPDSHRRESAPAAPLHDLSQSRNGNRDSHHNSPIVPSEKLHSSTTAVSQSANPSPRSTHYDPIRGLMSNSIEAPRSNPVTAAASPSLRMASTASVAASNGAAMLNRASASPAISSLVDPPPVSHASRPVLSHHSSTPNNNNNSNANSGSDTIIISSPTRQHLPSNAEYPSRTISAPLIEASKPTTVVAAIAAVPAAAAAAAAAAAPPQTQTLAPRESLADTAMDLDATNAATKPHSSRASISSGASPHSGPAKPKEKREKPPLPPLPGSGSGLLTSAMLGVAGAGPPGSTGGDDHKPAPVVCIEVKLEAGGNNIINFGRMAEQKYGFSALHPRLAAQKERLARVAAAGAMLENEARARAKGLDPDAMSEDLDGGSDEEKNAESTAEAGGASTAEAPKRKKRNFKEDNYDKADPFVDDSELGLEEQAALATDGFFVYCGPLVEEGRMPTIQGRPDGTTTTTTGRGRGRGRGRGGGPGSRGGKVPGVEGSGTGRGGGPGSRGGRGRGRGRGRGGAAAAAAAANNASPANRNDTPQQRQPYSDLSNYIRQYQPELEHGTPSKTAAAATTAAASSNQTNGYHGNAGGSAPSAIVVE